MPRDWRRFYGSGGTLGEEPVFVVRAFGHLLPPGLILDLAGGAGRNAVFLAAAGRPVLLVDREPGAVKAALVAGKGLPLQARVWDLERGLPALSGPLAGVLMSYYVERSLMDNLAALLIPGGLVLIEGFGRRQALRRGRAASPRYWDEGELLSAPPGLRLLAAGEGEWRGRWRSWAVWRRTPPN